MVSNHRNAGVWDAQLNANHHRRRHRPSLLSPASTSIVGSTDQPIVSICLLLAPSGSNEMFPLKRFIQGPSLHEETISYNNHVQRISNKGTLNGEEAKKAYEEIINLPSTANSVPPVVTSTIVRHKNQDNERSESEKAVAPKLSRLFFHCESNDHSALEKALKRFNNEIEINSVDEHGWTMLMSASCAGSLECVSILLQNGANWNLQDKKGQTALCLAEKRHKDTVCQLLREWIQCYIEHQERRRLASNLEDVIPSSENSHAEEPSSSQKQFCESCKINYKSTTDTHERSIAHLVSTCQFGEDKIHFGIPESNRGFQLMVKGGWDKNSGLGPDGAGHKFPVKTILKRNKLGLGNEKEIKAARITHFGPFDPAAVETQPERIEREVTVRKREATKLKCKDKRKEIRFRREFSSL